MENKNVRSEAWSFCIDRHSALGTPDCHYGQVQYSTTSKTIRTVQALEYVVWDFESASGEIKQAKSNFERTKSLTSSDTFLKNNFRRETETEIKSSVEIILKRWPAWAHFGNITWIWCNIYFTSIKRYVIHMTHVSYKKKKVLLKTVHIRRRHNSSYMVKAGVRFASIRKLH